MSEAISELEANGKGEDIIDGWELAVRREAFRV
jgi:hypothetical protein